jgi:carotenoid cleavage dioxygenase
MTKPLPESPFLSGNFAPWPMEGEVRDLEVEGEIPEALRGTYYRNGSNPQFPPGPNYHWFNGDGMIHAIRFDDDRCSYRNRWVRTARFELERELGGSLFGGFGAESDPRTEGVSGNASNTHVMSHAGKLLSLWEAGPPYEIDPETLETIGIHDYDGAFVRERFGRSAPDIMTAHPKVMGATGEWVAFGYSPMDPHLVYHEIDANGKLTRSDEIQAPFACMMHDFIASSEHVIFPHFPGVFDFESVAQGGSPITWKPELGTQIGVLARGASVDDVMWIGHDPCFSFHTVNAWTEGSKLVADLWKFPQLVLFETEQPNTTPPTLYRWTIDLESGSLREEQLDDAPAEFGRIDPRRMGERHRHVFSLGSIGIDGMSGAPEGFNSLFHYDLDTGSRKAHTLSGGDCFGEPVYIPASAEAKEGEGFVIALAYRRAEDRSEMLVLDAENLEAKPLAVIRLPHRIPFGFHGDWRPATA